MERKIIHIDMDAFYASVEQHDNPSLLGKPIAVGGSEPRGVVATASYEARKYGVHSAMSGVIARRLCPTLIFVKPRFERYKEISSRIRNIFYEYTDLVEPLSLDEAYLDVTTNKKNLSSATLIAEQIRSKIFEQTGLTASAGISINKFIAKIASDYNKPNGQKTVPPSKVLSFLEGLDVKKFYGIGKVTAEKMYQKGIFTGADLRAKSLEELQSYFGNSGEYFYQIARGIHLSPVQPFRLIKSIGVEHTFEKNISSEIFMTEPLQQLSEEVSLRLSKKKLLAKTVTLKLKYSDFKIQTRSRTIPEFIGDSPTIYHIVKELLYQEKLRESIRLLGVSLSNFNYPIKEDKEPHWVQLYFEFPPWEEYPKK
jgi:DNA polymerase IV